MNKMLTLVLALLFFVLQYEFWFTEGGVLSVFYLKQNVAEQIAINEKLKDRNLILMADIQNLKNGTEAIEDRARHELGMIKDGEVFYQVVQH